MYPKLIINPKKYLHNINSLMPLFKDRGLSVMTVTKSFLADKVLVDMINMTDVDYIADSRIKNLKKIKSQKKKVLLRVPSISDATQTVRYADISLNSELKTIIFLNRAAKKQHRVHDIILMFDIGDLREGIFYRDAYLSLVSDILKLEHIRLIGIGSNLTCYGGVIPNYQTMMKLEHIKQDIEHKFGIKLNVISGGNSSLYDFVVHNDFPKSINNVRIGELFICGRETSYGRLIDGLYDDVVTLACEFIEIKKKPSMPEGDLGLNAFGEKVSFVDRGETIRGILSIGKQDVHHDHLIPRDGIKILGSSSDHLIVEIDPTLNFEVGDWIKFKLSYGGILSLMQSSYVRRVYE